MKSCLLLLITLSACTSLPKGDLQLRKMILDDQPREGKERVDYVHSGRPLYVESTSYPYLLPDGHISMGGKILVYVGREELSLNELLPKTEPSSKKKEAPSPPSEDDVIKEKNFPDREIGGRANLSENKLNFPKTPGTETYEDHLRLQQASIKKKDQRVVNYYQCAKPKIIKNGKCAELQVEFDLSKCFGSPFIKQAHKVSCLENEALFGVKLNNVRYRVKTHRLPTNVDQWNLNRQINVTFYKP